MTIWIEFSYLLWLHWLEWSWGCLIMYFLMFILKQNLIVAQAWSSCLKSQNALFIRVCVFVTTPSLFTYFKFWCMHRSAQGIKCSCRWGGEVTWRSENNFVKSLPTFMQVSRIKLRLSHLDEMPSHLTNPFVFVLSYQVVLDTTKDSFFAWLLCPFL